DPVALERPGAAGPGDAALAALSRRERAARVAAGGASRRPGLAPPGAVRRSPPATASRPRGDRRLSALPPRCGRDGTGRRAAPREAPPGSPLRSGLRLGWTRPARAGPGHAAHPHRAPGRRAGGGAAAGRRGRMATRAGRARWQAGGRVAAGGWRELAGAAPGGAYGAPLRNAAERGLGPAAARVGPAVPHGPG